MSRAARFILIVGILVIAVGAVLILPGRSRNRNALARYEAELRANGEKLSAAELGYPRLMKPTTGLDRLETGLSKMGAPAWQDTSLKIMRFVAADRVEIGWATKRPRFSSSKSTPSPSWEELAAYYATHADALEEIRAAMQYAPRWFFQDLTNWFGGNRPNFVSMRKGAQVLADDAMVALHLNQLDRARADIHALSQFSQFLRDESHLGCHMVRLGIAGTGLSVTWEALQAQGWSDTSLAAVQKDWEATDFTDAFEKGMIGDRAMGEAAIAEMRSADPQRRAQVFHFGAALSSVEDYLLYYVAMPLWRANPEADEMFYLQSLQKGLDSFRKLHSGTPMVEVKRQFGLNNGELDDLMARPMAKYRYPFSTHAIPNYVRVGTSCVHVETQRRLTVLAIAIERYRLSNGGPPPDLNALVPRFLSAVPMDFMSAKPMGYKLNPDGSFTLYSVGEDGRDDGGDPNPSSVTNKFDLWSGKDAVWPTAVFDGQPTKK